MVQGLFFSILEEAETKYGADKIKVYTSTFVPMLYAIAETKVKCSMKLVCLQPEEKVRFPTCYVRNGILSIY